MNSEKHSAQLTKVIELHPHLKQAGVRVQSQRGNVVLTGTVGSYYEKQCAQESLKGLPGIDSVDNLLQVHWR